MDWRNRIVGLEYHSSKTLMDHTGNWRLHPQHQEDALKGVLDEVGVVDALLVYHSERQSGLTVIDGHLRKSLDMDAEWPCLMTDLTDEEADYVLATFDPVAQLIETSSKKLADLVSRIQTRNEAVAGLLNTIAPGRIPEGVSLPSVDYGQDASDMNGDEYDDERMPPAPTLAEPSNIKMVSLFFTMQTHQNFLIWCEEMKQHFQAENLTDTVYKALEYAYNQLYSASRR